MASRSGCLGVGNGSIALSGRAERATTRTQRPRSAALSSPRGWRAHQERSRPVPLLPAGAGEGRDHAEPWFDLRGFGTPVHLVLGFYFLMSGAALLGPFRPRHWPVLLAVHAALAALLSLPPLRAWVLGRLRERWHRAACVVQAWYPFFLVPLLYAEIPHLSRALHGGHYFDAVVMGWDQAWFGGQPSRSWAAAAPWLPLSELLHGAYLSYYLLIFLPPLALYLRGRVREFHAATFFFVLASTLHYLAFVYFPVQGPRYLWPAPDAGGIEKGPLYQLTHVVLQWGSSQGTAFPSGHVEVSVVQTLVCSWLLPGWRLWVGGLTLLLTLGTVYGGFHYGVDAVAGAVLGVVVAFAGRWILRQGARSAAVTDAAYLPVASPTPTNQAA